jgi:putative FmdB family regulatory protein
MIYEFKCKKCGKVFEENRKIEDRNKNGECPDCKNETERIASIFGFKINGFASINGYSHANR